MDNSQVVGFLAPMLHAHLVQSHLYVALLSALAGKLGYVDNVILALLRIFPKAMLEAACDRADAAIKARIEKDAAPAPVQSPAPTQSAPPTAGPVG